MMMAGFLEAAHRPPQQATPATETRRSVAASCSWVVAVAALAICTSPAAASAATVEKTADYRKFVAPHVPPEKTEVMVGVQLKKMLEMNPMRSTIRISLWFRRYWYDGRLSLSDPSADAAGLVDPDDIWTPDVAIMERVDEFQEACSVVNALVLNEQATPIRYNVFLSEACTFTVRCRLCLRNFPFDVNVCNLTARPWMDDSYTLRAENDDSPPLKTQQFAVTLSRDENHVNRTYDMPNGQQLELPGVLHYIIVDRYARYYGVNYICPLLTMVCLSWFSFFIPLNKSDRIAYAMTLVLTSMAVQFITAERRPAEKEDGWIDLFCTTSLIIITFPILQTTFLFRVQRAVELRFEAARASSEESPEKYVQRMNRAIHDAVTPLDRISRVLFPVMVIVWLFITLQSPIFPVVHSRTNATKILEDLSLNANLHEDEEGHYDRKRQWLGSFAITVFTIFWAPLSLCIMLAASRNWYALGPCSMDQICPAIHTGTREPEDDHWSRSKFWNWWPRRSRGGYCLEEATEDSVDLTDST